MRKLTVLLLTGAFLAIIGGASVARGGEFAIMVCQPEFLPGGPPFGGYIVLRVDTSFDTPEECVGGFKSCSKCVAAITDSGDLKLTNSELGNEGLGQFSITMIFAEKKNKRKDKD